MTLRDLRKINPNYFKDTITVSRFSIWKEAETDAEKLAIFKQRWLSCTATLSDWVEIGPVDIEALVDSKNLPVDIKQRVKKHQVKLYELWIEMYFQLKCLYTLKNIFDVSPRFAQEYAQTQLIIIGRLLNGDDMSNNSHALRLLKLEEGLDYHRLFQFYTSGDYKKVHSIYSESRVNWLEPILRYKTFLEGFIKAPKIEEPAHPEDFDEFSLGNLFPKTIKAFSKLYIEYSLKTRGGL